MHNHYLKPNWPACDRVKAVFTTRSGGYSSGTYRGFNLALHTGDNPDVVQKNRQLLRQELELVNEPCWLDQQHSNKVIYLDASYQYQIADAGFTNQSQIICTVLTADCLPILLTDLQGTTVAAIHAGWKSLATGIIENTLQTMLKKNDSLSSNNLLAWLGPAIGHNKFAVGTEVRQIFCELDQSATQAFVLLGEDKWLMNIYLIAKQQLHAQGITRIYGGEYCTFTDKDLFFSYRRDGEKTGRMASLIWINSDHF